MPEPNGYGGKEDMPKLKNSLSTKRLADVKSLPSRSKQIKVFDLFQDRFRRPHKRIGNARPKWYSQVFKSGDGRNCERTGVSLGYHLKHEMPNGIGTNVKLKTSWIGKFVVNSRASSLSERKVSSHPDIDIRRNFKCFPKPMAYLARKKSASSAPIQMLKHNNGFKGKKRNGIGT